MRFFLTALVLSSLSFTSANAQPYCNNGGEATVANVSWSPAQLVGRTEDYAWSGSDFSKAAVAANTYCSTFEGGGGSTNLEPDAGRVSLDIYAPYSAAHSQYQYSYRFEQGLRFRCNKCYAVPPANDTLQPGLGN